MLLPLLCHPTKRCRLFDGYWKYCAGLFATQKEASNYVQKVRGLGHKDAFVVVFYKGKRTTFEQVRALEKEKS